MKLFLKSLFNVDGKTKLNIVLDICFLTLFFATLVSIPIFSLKTKYTSITWILSILTFLIITIEFVFYYKIRIDIIVVSLILFLVSAIFSSAINGFKNFVPTPLLLNVATVIIYMYLKSNKNILKATFLAAYLALMVFVAVYLLMYGKDVITFNTERLGSLFGDQNDIALFLSLCFSISFYFVLKSKWYFKIVTILICVLSFLCGASTGSKIFIVSTTITLVTAIIVCFGKRRWYLSLIVISGIVVSSAVLFSMPFMSNLRNRLLTFINSFFDINYQSTTGVDSSSFDRYHLLKASFMLFLTKPLFGYGINGFQSANGFLNGWSHNNLGELLSDFGLIGTFLFNLPIVLSLYSFFSSHKNRTSDKKIGFIILVFFISAMISVAYTREKIYSFIIPISFTYLYDENHFFEFSLKESVINKLILKRRVIKK